MRRPLLLFLLLPFVVCAQQKERLTRIHISGLGALPMGQLNTASGNDKLTGQSTFGGGIDFMIGRKVFRRVFISAGFGGVVLPIERTAIEQLLNERYQRDGYYSDVWETPGDASVASMFIEVGCPVKIKRFEVEPFLRFGTCFYGIESTDKVGKVKLKKQGSNYGEEITIVVDKGDLDKPLWNLGTRANYMVHDHFYLTVSVSYLWSATTVTFKEEVLSFPSNSYDGNSWKTYQPVSVLRFGLGIQFRFGKLK